MADIKISQLGEALAVTDNDILPMTASGVTSKVKASTMKSYMVNDLDVSDLNDTTITTPTDDDGFVYDATAQKWENKQITTKEQWKKNGAYNLAAGVFTSQVKNEVTYVVNSDGTISANGTPPSNVVGSQLSSTNFVLKPGTYKLLGTPASGGNNKYILYLRDVTGAKDINPDATGSVIFTISGSEHTCFLSIFVWKSQTVNDIFKPMITTDLNATYDDYVPYAKTNRELTDDTSIKFYDLSSAKGTNVTFLSASAVKLGDMVFLQGHWIGSNNSSDIILTVPQELNPKATKVYGYGMAKFSTGYVAGEYSLKNSGGNLYQSISSSAGTEGEFSVIYSISKSTT